MDHCSARSSHREALPRATQYCRPRRSAWTCPIGARDAGRITNAARHAPVVRVIRSSTSRGSRTSGTGSARAPAASTCCTSDRSPTDRTCHAAPVRPCPLRPVHARACSAAERPSSALLRERAVPKRRAARCLVGTSPSSLRCVALGSDSPDRPSASRVAQGWISAKSMSISANSMSTVVGLARGQSERWTSSQSQLLLRIRARRPRRWASMPPCRPTIS